MTQKPILTYGNPRPRIIRPPRCMRLLKLPLWRLCLWSWRLPKPFSLASLLYFSTSFAASSRSSSVKVISLKGDSSPSAGRPKFATHQKGPLASRIEEIWQQRSKLR